MKPMWKPTPARAAVELLRRRREGLLVRFKNAQDDVAMRMFGKKLDDLDWKRGEVVDWNSEIAAEVFASFSEAELNFVIVDYEEKLAALPGSDRLSQLSDAHLRALWLERSSAANNSPVNPSGGIQ